LIKNILLKKHLNTPHNFSLLRKAKYPQSGGGITYSIYNFMVINSQNFKKVLNTQTFPEQIDKKMFVEWLDVNDNITPHFILREDFEDKK
jgi:hypothetical protein